MAGKRITTVDIMSDPNPSADFLLVVRAPQGDLRRMRMRRLPASFDLHDSVTDELTTLAGIDRLLISDEGTAGAPQKFVKLSTLRSFLLDLFDLHDDVPTELTVAANEDRMLISDESEAGDPQKFITVEKLKASLGIPRIAFMDMPLAPWPLQPSGSYIGTLNHSLGVAPKNIEYAYAECVQADSTFGVGDRVYPRYHGGSLRHFETGLTFQWGNESANSIQYRITGTASPGWSIRVPKNLTGSGYHQIDYQNKGSWKIVWSLRG